MKINIVIGDIRICCLAHRIFFL